MRAPTQMAPLPTYSKPSRYYFVKKKLFLMLGISRLQIPALFSCSPAGNNSGKIIVNMNISGESTWPLGRGLKCANHTKSEVSGSSGMVFKFLCNPNSKFFNFNLLDVAAERNHSHIPIINLLQKILESLVKS